MREEERGHLFEILKEYKCHLAQTSTVLTPRIIGVSLQNTDIKCEPRNVFIKKVLRRHFNDDDLCTVHL